MKLHPFIITIYIMELSADGTRQQESRTADRTRYTEIEAFCITFI